MSSIWLKTKEAEKVCAENLAFCEARATKKFREEKILELINKGQEYDYQRIMQTARKELEQEQTLTRKKKQSEQACWDLQWTQKLAEEVWRLKNEEIKQQKQRQLLRLTSVEVGQLEKVPETVDNVKSLQIQLKEREAIRANTRCQELQQDKAIKGWYQNDYSERDNLLGAYKERGRYRKDLQDQLIINCRKKEQKSKKENGDRKLRGEITQLLKDKEAEEARKKGMLDRLNAEKELAFPRSRNFEM